MRFWPKRCRWVGVDPAIPDGDYTTAHVQTAVFRRISEIQKGVAELIKELPMQKPTLFNLEITLNCVRCRKEVPMENPFEKDLYKPLRDIPQMFNDAINQAYTDHQAGSYCTPKPKAIDTYLNALQSMRKGAIAMADLLERNGDSEDAMKIRKAIVEQGKI